MAHRELFRVLMGYALMLAAGPWMLVQASSYSLGPFDVMFSFGMLASLPDGRGWVLRECGDCVLIAGLFTSVVVLPVVLWVAWVVSYWEALCAQGKLSNRVTIGLAQLVAVLPPLTLWCKVAGRLIHSYGPAALLLSPAMGWLPVMVVWWLRAARARTIKSRGE